MARKQTETPIRLGKGHSQHCGHVLSDIQFWRDCMNENDASQESDDGWQQHRLKEHEGDNSEEDRIVGP